VQRTEGEPHERTFWVLCEVSALDLRTQGSGSSRQRAEQQAAERALAGIEANGQE